jgi:hypothetical protein
MSRRGRRRKRSSEGVNWVAMVVIGLVVAAVGVLFVVSVGSKPKRINELTLCVEDEAHPAVLAIIIDSTDSIPAGPARKIYQRINSSVESLPVNARIQLFEMRGATSLAEPLVDICKPDDGSNASQFTSNPEFIKKTYQEKFANPLQDSLRSLIDEEPQPSSPIIESIQSASLQLLMPNESVGEKRLIVASDFLQHSDLYSMYSEQPNAATYRERLLTSSVGTIDLYDAQVDFLVIPRAIPLGDRTDLTTFWSEFLMNHGAAFGSSLEPL